MTGFQYSAYPEFQNRGVGVPGKIFDRADQDGKSYVPAGGPAPYGRMLVRGISNVDGSGYALDARQHTMHHSCSLPDLNGDYLTNPDTGLLYKDEGFALPLDPDGLLIPLGVGMWTEYGSPIVSALTQPWGLGDTCYQQERCGQMGIANQGRLWAYCETDMNEGDKIYFRTVVTDDTDGLQLLGSFGNAAGGEWQEYPKATVFQAGPAGGAFVIDLNNR